MVVLVTVAAVAAMPKKPTKEYPKKYDAALHGTKDTYSVYSHAPDEDLVVPAANPFAFDLVPPSSYDAYFEQEPQDPIVPPEGSTYTWVPEVFEGDKLVPPQEYTYSSHSGVALANMTPPPVSPTISTSQGSYLSYDESAPQDPMEAPELSSYAQTPSDKSGSEVLASLAAMIHALPHTSSYADYSPSGLMQDGDKTPDLILLPPSAEEQSAPLHSSYSQLPADQPALTAEQVAAAEEANIPIPSTDLLPPAP